MEDGNYIWASSVLGLYVIHKEKGVVQKYNATNNAPFQLPINEVYFLHKDVEQNYWLATSSTGLIRFNINDDFEITEFKQYTEEDGLSSNILYAILEDDKERLWISTFKGITCLDKKTGYIQTFSKEDGINELEFFTLNYDENYLHTGKEMFRIAHRLRLEAQETVKS